ncbi:MAG: hypothetical protein NTZ80_00875 [Patescibacteria group bacterium]|nr:hypothetical protein [Patescibacteria group bacterium]
MIKLLRIITFNIFLGILFTYTGEMGNPQFLSVFLNSQILPISATIVGFNIAGIIFLIGHLLQLRGDFSNTKKEIMHNIYLVGILFLVILLLLLINPVPTKNMYCDFAFKSTIMTLFFFQIYAVYEIVKAVFTIEPNR